MSSEGTMDLASDRVQLTWPNKNEVSSPVQGEDGRWNIQLGRGKSALRGLNRVERYGTGDANNPSLLLAGQRHDALLYLRNAFGPVFRLIYVDLPRLNVDDATTAFATASTLRLTTWLTVTRTLLIEARELLSRTGVVALHCGEDESAYAKLIADEIFRDKRVGTIIWQKTYSARNMPGMKEFTDAHDLLYIYARDKDSLPPVGLRSAPKDYSNDDSDPRGPWKAEHKGAKTRRENSDFDTYQPPYRWRLVDGALPPGLWRVSPFTGVIWGVPRQSGTYSFNVEASDRSGATAKRRMQIVVTEKGVPPALPNIPWLFAEQEATGALKVTKQALPDAVVGEPYSAILLAEGGDPYRGAAIRPGSGRYWDFAKATLIEAYQHDAVYLGSREPTSIPTPKKYQPPEGVMQIENQQSIWLGRVRATGTKEADSFAGFTEDATKHLKALKELGLVRTEVPTAKPEKLLARLLEIFTDKGDIALELMSTSADMACVALKTGRRFVSLQGCSPRDVETMQSCALPRLRAVIDGEDKDLEQRAPAIRLSAGAYLPYAGGGSFLAAELGPELASLLPGEERPTLSPAAMNMGEVELIDAILTAEGYWPIEGTSRRTGRAINGHAQAVAISAKEFLTPELASTIASDAERNAEGAHTTVYYFRATEDLDEKLFGGRVLLRRVPFDLLSNGSL